MPDSISSTQSPFNIGVLVDAVLAESSYFGATRSEHAQTRQENFQTFSRICVKADPWAIIPTCRAMQGTVSSSSITLVLFTLCQMEFEFQLFKNTTLTPRIRRRFRFGDQKLILSTLTALTLIPKKFSVYWNSSDRVFSAKEQSKVLSSALRITSMNSRGTHLFFGPSPLPFGGSTVLETYSSTTSRSRPRTRGVSIRG